MCAAVESIRRNANITEWVAFALQVLIAISVELGDDLGRGLVSQHGTVEGIQNAQRVVAIEAAHGFWVEPAWQMFFERTHHVLMLTLTWATMAHVMNGIYVLGHVCVTLSMAVWVYVYHRRHFRLLRNAMIFANFFALLVYESFPVAPPRLMRTGLLFDGKHFVFQDTLYGVFTSTSHVVGTSTAYNEFSAMPSVHMCWALIVGVAVVTLARPWPFRLLGAAYPLLMLLAIVVTANHYLLDAAGAVVVVALALSLALAVERYKGRVAGAIRPRLGVVSP